MKINLLLLTFLPLIISCGKPENSKQIYYYKDSSYEMKISTIDNKVNKEGKAQCSKYQLSNMNDTIFSSYGLQLNSLLAKTNGSTTKYFDELPFDSLDNKYIDVRIENYTDKKLNFDSVLSMHLCKIFNLEIISVDSIVSGYKLEIQDSLKLNSHKALHKNGTVKFTDGIWIASCIKLYELAKILDDNSIKYISCDNLNEDCYSIEFYSGSDIEKINAKLKHYGITLNKNDIVKKFFKIKTVANKI